MTRSRQSAQQWSSFLLLVAIVLGAFGALFFPKAEIQEPEVVTKVELPVEPKVEPKVESKVIKPATKIPTPQPKTAVGKRIPIAGSPGEFIVIQPDGSTYRESANGKEQLTTPEVPKKAPEVVVLPQVRVPSLAIVLDKGVISIPKDAIVTFIGADHLVTHESDGSSITYFVDGKVIRKDARSRVTQEK